MPNIKIKKTFETVQSFSKQGIILLSKAIKQGFRKKRGKKDKKHNKRRGFSCTKLFIFSDFGET